ncbi:MAG TPA: glycosyltransferase family 2 protein [Dokdonella sp.]|uniref:glycosyltransferase family 2 protein n=1 Tax=Dokdonella sp. TaxID=2291710 RepID=UPI002CEA7EBD|nr:glycosyltransferase family 2 protein [Dokdonella sp.]HUD41309.1 glycosyltransferase family 2 protein [Dokdonella sp.]
MASSAPLFPTPAGHRTPHLSVVVPCYNEEAVLGQTHQRLTAACAAAVGEDYEIVYVDDGSRDATWPQLEALAARDGHVVAVSLSRNFGHQLALSGGLSVARGERILMIDADLQDPPELLDVMMRRMDAGADVVYGLRTEREGETAFKKSSARLFYRTLNRLTDLPIPENVGDFRLINRRVLDALLAMPEQHRFVRGLIAWLGFRQEALPYVRHARAAGETKYPLRRMLKLAADAITGFSVRPLRVSILFAGLSFGVALAILLYALVSWMLGDTARGWTSLIIIVALFSGVQLLCLGIIGEYLGRMFMELKRRPLFVFREIRTQEGGAGASSPSGAERAARVTETAS